MKDIHKKEIKAFISDPEKEAELERFTKFNIYRKGNVLELRLNDMGSNLIVSYDVRTGNFNLGNPEGNVSQTMINFAKREIPRNLLNE
jgi:hypothetical protein